MLAAIPNGGAQARSPSSDPGGPGPGVSRRDFAVDSIRAAIIDGRLAPGDLLVESQLAEQLGVSRVPIREALQRLSEQGFIETRPGQTARVAQRRAHDMLEMFDVREVLEGLACSQAAARVEPSARELLQARIDDLRAATEAEDWEGVGAANLAFHGTIAQLSRNQHLIELIESYRYRLAWTTLALAKGFGTDHWQQHVDVAQAIVDGDAERAERIGREHVRLTKQLFVRIFLDGRHALT